MAKCFCGKDTITIDVCSWLECKKVHLCLGCNKDIKECICKI